MLRGKPRIAAAQIHSHQCPPAKAPFYACGPSSHRSVEGGSMRPVLAGIILTWVLVPSPAWPAPPGMKPVGRAAAVMEECGMIAGRIAALKAPAGLQDAKPSQVKFLAGD